MTASAGVRVGGVRSGLLGVLALLLLLFAAGVPVLPGTHPGDGWTAPGTEPTVARLEATASSHTVEPDPSDAPALEPPRTEHRLRAPGVRCRASSRPCGYPPATRMAGRLGPRGPPA